MSPDARDRDSGPIKLGLLYALLLVAGCVGAAIWVLLATTPQRTLDNTLPVAASAVAALAVGLLALAALQNSLANLFGWPHVWVLPANVQFRPDFLVAIAVVAGIIGGYLVWR